MLTPQQIDRISFGKAKFGGYDMASVDAFLEPLTEDYVTLYKENAQLKSKMKVLVEKLEEHRRNEASAREAAANAQKTYDRMVREAEAKCARMIEEATAAAQENAKNSMALVDTDLLVEDAKKASSAKIAEIQEQLRSCIEALDQIKASSTTVVEVPKKPKLTGIPSVDRPWMQYYPEGTEKMMVVPEVTVNQYMKMMCKGMDLPVIHYYGTDISWDDFFRMVDEAARALKAAGLGVGDQVPVMLRAVPEFLVVLLAAEQIGASLLCRDNSLEENAEAVAKSGAKVMFVHNFVTRAEIQAYTEAGIKKFITVNPWRMAVKKTMPDYIVNSLQSNYTEPLVVGPEICTWETFMAAGAIFAGKVEAPIDLDRPLFRAYTSGSTGTSKQVIHSTRTILSVVFQMSAYGSSDQFRPTWLLTLLPPALVAVTVAMMLMPMASNKLLILDPFMEVEDVDLEFMRYRPNCWPHIPMFIELLMRSERISADYDMSHLIVAGAGCEAFNNGQVDRAQKFLNDHGCKVDYYSVAYGQSESGSNVTFPCQAYPSKNGNVGIPMPLNLVSIFRGDRECTYNKLGEICICGPGNMLGYDNEEATNKTLVRHSDGRLWLHTGDTGYMNEDGVIFTLGRGLAKRYNEDPEKAERLVEVMLENLVSDAKIPGVKDCFFVIRPDQEHEGYFVPYMYVVLEEGYTIDVVSKEVDAVLMEYQRPVEIIQIPERPFYHFKTNRLHMEAPYAR